MRESLKYRFKLLTIRVLLLFCLILLSSLISAQTIPVRHYTLRNGLPSMGIRCIFKDSRGLLWIGTDAGLCTFDGKTFRTILPSEGMTANQVWSIAEDNAGNLWFGSFGDGLYKYDGKHFRKFTRKDGLADDRIRVLCYSKKFHCLLAGSYGCVSMIKESTIENFPVNRDEYKLVGIVTGMVETDDFFYITSNGLWTPCKFYPGSKKFETLYGKSNRYPHGSYSVFISSKGDTVFSDFTRGVWILEPVGKILKADTLGQIYSVSEDRKGDIWLSAWSLQGTDLREGIYRHDGNTFRNYKKSFGITDKEVWTLFFDRDQNILWIGTLNDGLYMVPFCGFQVYSAGYFSSGQQKINSVFLDSKARLWISGSRELSLMDSMGNFTSLDKTAMVKSYRKFYQTSKNRWQPYKDSLRLALVTLEPEKWPEFARNSDFQFGDVVESPDHSFIIPNEIVLFDYEETNGKFIAHSSQRTNFRYAFTGDTLVESGWEITSLHPHYKNNNYSVYIASQFPYPGNGEPRDVNRIVQNGNHLWYASWHTGLWMSRGRRLVHFNKQDSTISNGLNDICFDEKGHVIFGSNNGEIYIASYQNDSLTIHYRINDRQGLQGNSISWLVADQKGRLWAGTNTGLNCIDLDSLYLKDKYIIRFMDEEEGYTGQVSKRAVLDQRGRLWIAAGEKLISLDTRKFYSEKILPGKIILKSLEISILKGNTVQKLNVDSLSSSGMEQIRLKHFENNLIFTWDILNYLNPGKDRFRYRLEGFDENWHPRGIQRSASYTNLPPGNYAFQVESGNLYSAGYAVPLIFELNIRHPWWGLWTVQLAAGVLCIALIILILRLILKNERKKQVQKSEIKKRIAQLEMQALQAQMNPHFIFNCVNGIQYYVLANKMDEVLAYLSDFSKVVGESLANATVKMVPLEKEIEFLHSYLRLERMRFPGRFGYEIRYTGDDDAALIQVPPMLVQPFAENAIRHGFMKMTGTGQLSIVFEAMGTYVLKCTVTDNGIGRERAREEEGMAGGDDRAHSATITARRIGLFNTPEEPGKYRIDYTDLLKEDQPCGLKVEVFMPVSVETKGLRDLKI